MMTANKRPLMLFLLAGCLIAVGCGEPAEEITEENAKRALEKSLVTDNKDNKEWRRSKGMETYYCYSLKNTYGIKNDAGYPYLDYEVNVVERRFADDVVVSEHTEKYGKFSLLVFYSERDGKWLVKCMG